MTGPDSGDPPAFADCFSAVASEYAAHRPRYPAALFDYVASLAPGHGLAWDCAAGNGQASIGLTAHFDRVVATDASAAQLAAASAHSRVEYRQADARASGLEPRSADLVTVAQAAHWLDLDAFYAEARRVLRPAGAVALWTYGLERLDDPVLDAIVSQFYHADVGPYWLPGRAMVDDAYRRIPFPFAEVAAPAFEMTVQWRRTDFLAYVGTWSAVTRFRQARRADPVITLLDRLASQWDADAVRTVRWPIAMRAGRLPVTPA